MERKEMRKIFNILQKEFNLDATYTVGYCCGTCSCYEYYEGGAPENVGKKRVMFNKHYDSGMNKTNWKDDVFFISYNSKHLPYTEMNEIGLRFCKLAEELFNEKYRHEKLEDNSKCLTLIKIGGRYDEETKRDVK